MIFGGPAGCCGGEIQGMTQLMTAIGCTGLAILLLSIAGSWIFRKKGRHR